MNIIAIVQASSVPAARRGSLRVGGILQPLLTAPTVQTTTTSRERPAVNANDDPTGTWQHVVAYKVTSSSEYALERMRRRLREGSPWPIRDVDRDGAFVMVGTMNGVKQWRLFQTLGTSDHGTHVHLQVRGPSVGFRPIDAIWILLALLLVVSFGATERNSRDPFAFPMGMHPFVIAIQVVVVGALVCATVNIEQSHARGSGPGLLILTAVTVLAEGRWLYLSRRNWVRTLRAAWFAIMISLAMSALFAVSAGLTML